MKEKILAVLFLFVGGIVFAQQLALGYYDDGADCSMFISNKDGNPEISLRRWQPDIGDYAILGPYAGEVYIDSNRFKHVKFAEAGKDYIVIDGFTDASLYPSNSMCDMSKGMNIWGYEAIVMDMRPVGRGITSATASSCLKDSFHEYRPTYTICTLYSGECSIWGFTSNAYPWVEGKSGYGIGEWIEITAEYEFSTIKIMNGYVNPAKPKLYAENSRVKKATLILDDSYSQTIEFNDWVELFSFKLDKSASKVRIVIDEVYEGTKYDDTCITAIGVVR